MAWPDQAPIVEVTWEDSHSRGGWRTPEEWRQTVAEQGNVCVSVGYLLHRDERRIVLAQSAAEAGTLTDAIDIPLSAVRDLRIIEEASPWPAEDGCG